MADHISIAVGKELRRERLSKGIKQRDMAKELGITSQQLSKHENGKSPMSVTRLMEAAGILRIDAASLLPDPVATQ